MARHKASNGEREKWRSFIRNLAREQRNLPSWAGPAPHCDLPDGGEAAGEPLPTHSPSSLAPRFPQEFLGARQDGELDGLGLR